MKNYTYVVSDIHGQFDAFEKMLKKIKFKDDDIMYIIGDVIDRGPEPIKIIEYIMQKKNMVLLAGNHEHMAVICINKLLSEINQNVIEWRDNGSYRRMATKWWCYYI